MKFVVGLGNPGPQYAMTRHNVGFMVVQSFARRWNSAQGRKSFGGVVFDARTGRSARSARIVLFTPHTFMNRSGEAVRELISFYKADPANLLIVLDDIALPTGQLRLRVSGTSGGHNGLADVLTALGTGELARLRIGVGSPPAMMDAADYVLQPFGSGERETIESAISRACDAVEDWVFEPVMTVMDKYNIKTERLDG